MWQADEHVTTRGLRATLVHELDVEWSWRLNLQGALTDAEQDLNPEDYRDVAAIRAHWQRDEAEMRAWLEPMTDDDITIAIGDSSRAWCSPWRLSSTTIVSAS